MAAKILLLLLPVCGVLSQGSFVSDYKETTLGKPVDLASVKLLKEAIENAKGENVVTSPLGVLILLSLYSAGTSGALREDITKVLGGSNYTQLTTSYSQLSQQLHSLGDSYLTLANKIYVAEGGQLVPAFQNTAKSYNSAVEQLNFLDKKKAVEVINEWAKEKTRGHITSAVSEDLITPDIAVALFNVIYFQGHWHVPFSVEGTAENDFHVSKTEKVKKPMMSLYTSLFYHKSEELAASLVELPYKESGFRMVVVLPDEIDGLPSVVEKVAQKGLLSAVNQLKADGATVDLLLPKFNVESSLDLNKILEKMGLSKLFESSAEGIVEGSPVKVSKAFQKAFIKVDEEGATAGAFTGFLGVNRITAIRPSRVFKFHADHPFLYSILYGDTILFIGIYKN